MSYDTGDKSIQCGRKVDCLKLWLMWKATGTLGLEQRVDRAFAYTRYNGMVWVRVCRRRDQWTPRDFFPD
ncbi:UNVERIFIED_CONTAM: hypothetical protein FKN15_031577 [Acipenser sinensis]